MALYIVAAKSALKVFLNWVHLCYLFFHLDFRLSCRKNNNDSFPSVSTLFSPLMKTSLDSVRETCMDFSYYLSGQGTQIDVWIKPRNMNNERLWSVRSVNPTNSWKSGRVFLGRVSQFRVGWALPFFSASINMSFTFPVISGLHHSNILVQ